MSLQVATIDLDDEADNPLEWKHKILQCQTPNNIQIRTVFIMFLNLEFQFLGIQLDTTTSK